MASKPAPRHAADARFVYLNSFIVVKHNIDHLNHLRYSSVVINTFVAVQRHHHPAYILHVESLQFLLILI